MFKSRRIFFALIFLFVNDLNSSKIGFINLSSLAVVFKTTGGVKEKLIPPKCSTIRQIKGEIDHIVVEITYDSSRGPVVEVGFKTKTKEDEILFSLCCDPIEGKTQRTAAKFLDLWIILKKDKGRLRPFLGIRRLHLDKELNINTVSLRLYDEGGRYIETLSNDKLRKIHKV